jgi:hypothetical protein
MRDGRKKERRDRDDRPEKAYENKERKVNCYVF